MKKSICVMGTLAILSVASAPAGEVSFTAKPVVKKTGDTFKIAFAVSAPTDVAVYIEDAKGEVVRHLVAGVLGTNAPAPLKPGLAQEIEWDGKADYGRPLPAEASGGGGFQVRVGLGLAAKYDRVAYDAMADLLSASAGAVAPDGTFYVRARSGMWGVAQWQIFGRDGTYQGAWAMPPGEDGKRYFGKAFADGRPDPMEFSGGKYVSAGMVFKTMPGSDAVAVSRDGNDLFQIGGTTPASIYRYPLTATYPQDDKFAVTLDGGGAAAVAGKDPCLAVSSDGRTLYVGGLATAAKKALPAVYAVKCPERTGCRIFFGDPAKTNKDETSLGGAPSGLAADGKGRLFIVDGANNRVVVVDEKDGKYLGEIATDRPREIGVSTRTGAIYVLGLAGGKSLTLSRFNPPAGSDPRSWKDLKPEAAMPAAGASNYLAVDDSSTPTVIWRNGGGGWDSKTVRIEDTGSGPKFGTVTGFSAKGYRPGPDAVQCGNLQVDRLRKEVYFRNGYNGLVQGRFVEKTGQTEFVRLQYQGYMQGGGTGMQIVPAANGNIYGIAWAYYLFQWDRNGKKLRWQDATYADPIWTKKVEEFRKKGMEHSGPGPGEAYVPVSMSVLPHMLGMRWSDGHFFVFHPRTEAGGARCLKAMHEYLPSGREVTAPDNYTIWKVSDAAVGPKFDAAGNIYIAEAVRPKGWVMPPELAGYYTNKGVSLRPSKNNQFVGPVGIAAGLYGSIVKFSPKGGMVKIPSKKGDWGLCTNGEEPYTGEPKLDPGLTTVDVDVLGLNSTLNTACKVTGAEWIHPGFGHIGFYGCNCENVTFDVDEFGRVFFPDTPQFQVGVIDTAGNPIARFGGYGGPNCLGPEGPVVDPKTNRVRPRRADDPKDLKSPFAAPDLGFQWLVGVGVTDRYAYFGDSINQRLLRAKLVYAAEESCPVP